MGTKKNMAKFGFRKICSCVSFLLIFSLSISLVAGSSFRPSVEQTPQVLASSYAPVLHFTQDEKFYPTSVDHIISSSVLKQRNSNGSSFIVDSSPTPNNLGTYTSSNLFLDNKLGTFDAIAGDYASKFQDLGFYAYVHVVSSDSSTIIQYWLFYSYNNGPLNDHQGDIEVIQVFLDGSGSPQKVLLSQHFSGENAAWSDVEKQGTHPVVYVAQGSHANYFKPYQGKIGLENDIVGSNGRTIVPSSLNLFILGEKDNHSPDQSWLDFAGRWGYWGTDQEVALGMVGPLGPIFSQDGVRWAQPQSYLDQTFSVSSNYFTLAWIAANFLLIFFVYTAIMGVWKTIGIVRLQRASGLMVGKFLKSRGSIGLMLGVLAILLTVAALALPWYNITASSQAGPLAGQGDVSLMTIDGINGLRVNMFLGSNGESSSGYKSLFSTQIPFSIMMAAGIVLLALDVIGVKNGKSIGRKFMISAVTSLLPFIIIFVFMMQLPSLMSLASSLMPDQSVLSEVEQMARTIAANPISGTVSQQFPVVGTTTVKWGFGIGAYIFLVAAIVRIIAGIIMRSAPELQGMPVPMPSPPASTTPISPEKQ